MESSPFTLINKKWMLCTFASFLSFLFLSLFLNQKLQLTAILSTFNEEKAKGTCDFFEGKWFYDGEAYPLYHGHECPFLDAQVNCQKNGRPDSGYEHWRWEANNCEIPRCVQCCSTQKSFHIRFLFRENCEVKNSWHFINKKLTKYIYKIIYYKHMEINLHIT